MTASPLPGRPLWIDLTTHDTDGAREFYRELFGWEFEDQGADFGHYAIITKDGGRVGGLMTSMMGQEGPTSEPTGPTTWSVFLHTDDIDAALAAIPTVGGQVFYGPMDIGDQGRQAFVSDPAGAALGLWQPLDLPGFAMPGTHGTPVWFEVQSNDLDAALPFYRDVLHWDIHWLGGSPHASDGMRYAMNGPKRRPSLASARRPPLWTLGRSPCGGPISRSQMRMRPRPRSPSWAAPSSPHRGTPLRQVRTGPGPAGRDVRHPPGLAGGP